MPFILSFYDLIASSTVITEIILDLDYLYCFTYQSLKFPSRLIFFATFQFAVSPLLFTMAIPYSSKIATASHSAFFSLLCRWRGSIYKLIWIDLLVFCILYSTIALVYHLSPICSPNLLDVHRQILNFLDYVKSMSNSLPISFILGFFVNLVVNRWIDQFNYLPTSDGVSMLTCAYIRIPHRLHHNKVSSAVADEVAVIRQSIARYINLAAVLCFQTIAPNVRKVYENTQNYITSGLMTEKEHEYFGQVDPRYHPFYVPLMWAITIVKRAKVHGYITHERHMNALIDESLKFRRSLFTLLNYDSVPIPLVYTQVSLIHLLKFNELF